MSFHTCSFKNTIQKFGVQAETVGILPHTGARRPSAPQMDPTYFKSAEPRARGKAMADVGCNKEWGERKAEERDRFVEEDPLASPITCGED